MISNTVNNKRKLDLQMKLPAVTDGVLSLVSLQ